MTKPDISKNFLAIDVETANADRSSICQIGIVEVENGVFVNEWSTFVNPLVDFHPRNRRLHGISARMVADQPTFAEVYETLKEMLKDRPLAAHSKFDKQALLAATIKNGLKPLHPSWLDSRQIANGAWHGSDVFSNGFALDEICENLGISFKHHDALEDAKAAAQIIIRACEDTKLTPQALDIKGEALGFHNKKAKKPIGSIGIHLINAVKNENKASAYWLGFLEGVIASKDVIEYEIDPLVSQSEDLLSKFDDADAQDLISDIQIWRDEPAEILGVLSNIVEMRELEEKPGTQMNKFYGFLKGIACDGVVCVNELELLLAKLKASPELREDSRINEIYNVGVIALQDGVVSKHESDELCLYIARVVGDSFHDTGISRQNDTPHLDGEIKSFEEIVFEERSFVLTGSFKVPKSVFSKRIEVLGGKVRGFVSRKTDYLIIADDGSESYKTTNAGLKTLKAIDLYKESGKPEFVRESMLSALIDANS